MFTEYVSLAKVTSTAYPPRSVLAALFTPQNLNPKNLMCRYEYKNSLPVLLPILVENAPLSDFDHWIFELLFCVRYLLTLY